MQSTLEKAILADYFGVVVEVVWRMDSCSMIFFRGQKFIVETADVILTELSK
jgi:hypothetical protein